MMKNLFLLNKIISACAIGLLLTQCTTDNEESLQPQNTPPPSTVVGVNSTPGSNLPDVVSLSTHIRPIFNTYRCSNVGCHGGNSQAGGINLTDYNKFKAFATNGTLYNVMANGSMPPGGPRVTANDLALVKKWVDQGALDN